ncbi:MAG: ATP-binding protein [Oscillospiraceae bacterium]|nr:ATP-binding protein [Oscillospiraceae bacterium]
MIARRKEMQELNELYASNKAELVAVYGRRRVGKTYLIDETFRERITFRHAGVSPAGKEKRGMLKKQLDAFYYSLLRSGMPERKKPKSWLEAFYLLETFLDGQRDGSRQLVFIDELPWLDTQRSDFMTAFENFWNGWACYHNDLMVIVCGSSNSWILDNLINNHGGLYNRVTYEMKLAPFTLRECEQLLEEKDVGLTRYDIAQAYMAVGGIPYYFGYFKRGNSLAQNLDFLFFSQGAKLRDEFDRLFDSVFDQPERIKSIVRLLYTRKAGFSRGELLDKLNMTEGETFSKCLKALLSSEFVVKYVPFGNRENQFLYRLADPFCLFYLHFVDGHPALPENFWLQNLESQSVASWCGLAFETVCFNHIRQIKNALGIAGVSTMKSAWIKRSPDTDGMQIDLIISRRDHIVNLCEIKFSIHPFTVDQKYYNIILDRAAEIKEHVPPTTAIHNTLISTFGVKENRYSKVFTNVITLEDLFT